MWLDEWWMQKNSFKLHFSSKLEKKALEQYLQRCEAVETCTCDVFQMRTIRKILGTYYHVRRVSDCT